MSNGNPNLKENWTVLGYSLLFIFGIICWPLTLTLLGLYIVSKVIGSIFWINKK